MGACRAHRRAVEAFMSLAVKRLLHGNSSTRELTLILLLATVLRLDGIRQDLPFVYDPDEGLFVGHAISMLKHHSLNPGWFGAPASTTMYLLEGTYAVLYVVGSALHRFEGAAGFKAFYEADPTWFYLSGRLWSALFGVALVWLVYRVARRLFTAPVALLAALLAALSPELVLLSQMLRMDMQMTFLVLVVFWYSLDVLETGTWRAYILAGVFTGLATVTKYPAVTVAAVVLVAHLFRWKRNVVDHRKLLAAGASSIMAAFAGSPYLFLSFRQALADLRFEARPSHLSHTGEGLLANFGWYWTGPISSSLTMLGAVVTVVGLIVCLRPSRKDRILLALHPLLFLTFISSLALRWSRWAVPALPFLAILEAAPVDALRSASFPRFRRATTAAAALLVLCLAVGLGRSALGLAREVGAESTQTLARRWIIDHIPSGSSIVEEAYCPQLPRDRHHLYGIASGALAEIDPGNPALANWSAPGGRLGALSDVEELRRRGVQYMVLSDF
jgi:hypothetical protein